MDFLYRKQLCERTSFKRNERVVSSLNTSIVYDVHRSRNNVLGYKLIFSFYFQFLEIEFW